MSGMSLAAPALDNKVGNIVQAVSSGCALYARVSTHMRECVYVCVCICQEEIDFHATGF